MGEALLVARDCASNSAAASCIEFPIVAESCKWFPGLAKFLSAKKPAAAVHFLTDEPERTCYEWVRGKFDPPARVIIRLLHTDQGHRVLDYLMRGNKQPWWLELKRAQACASAYERAREQLELNL